MSAKDSAVATLKKGHSFGELALILHAARAATVKCCTAGTCWVINRYSFKSVLQAIGSSKIQSFLRTLEKIKLFDCLLADEREALAYSLIETHWLKGDVIIREGDDGTAFFVLAKGVIKFTKEMEAGKEPRHISTMDAAQPARGIFFGERSLLKQEKRAATATVVSDEAVTLALTKEKFEELLGSLEGMIRDAPGGGGSQRKSRVAGANTAVQRQKPCEYGEWKTGALLGCGGFGAVRMVEFVDKNTGQTTFAALKALSKGYVVKTKMQQGTVREKDILAMCDSPFVIRLYATYKDQQYLYFLMELALGGELYATYHKHRFHGDKMKAKFYSASVVYCFEHLHSKNILYRDLKPENLLMDRFGKRTFGR